MFKTSQTTTHKFGKNHHYSPLLLLQHHRRQHPYYYSQMRQEQQTEQPTSHVPAAERFMYRAVELPVPGRLLAVLGLREEAVVGRTFLRTRRRGTDGPRTPLSPLWMRCLRRSCREGEGMYVCRSLDVTKGARVCDC